MPDDRFVDALTDHLDTSRGLATDPARGPDGGIPDDTGLDVAAVVAELRRESTWTGPPPGLRESILAQVVQARAEQQAPPEQPIELEQPEQLVRPEQPVEPERRIEDVPAADPAPTAISELDEARARRSRRSRVAWGLTAVAAVAASFTAGVLATDSATTPAAPPGRQFLAAGSSLAPSASATVTVAKGGAGFSVQLDLHDLPAAAPGSYYAAWLRGPDGLVAIGTFHGRAPGSPFKLWSGVDPVRYPEFVVTLQSEGDPMQPSDRVVLRGTLR
jgi:hypothetical protein